LKLKGSIVGNTSGYLIDRHETVFDTLGVSFDPVSLDPQTPLNSQWLTEMKIVCPGYWALRSAKLTMLVTVSDLQDKEAEETEQKIINEGQMRLPTAEKMF
jgi:hypothetical protein